MSLQAPVRDTDWQDRARCATAGLDLFFPDGTDSQLGKAYCAGCPVWEKCLVYGMDEDFGVWGGLNHAERSRLGRLRARFAKQPDHPRNVKDVRWLLGASAGMSRKRLAYLLGCPVETVADLAQRQRPRRKAS